MSDSSSLGHILIVDDDPNIASLLSINLKSEGYSIDVAESAEKVDRDAQEKTKLVIVDAMQQSYSGMDLIYDFKGDPKTEHIAIILCSNFKSERMVIEALDAGADDYVLKPFSLRILIARVKSVLRRHGPMTSASGGNIIAFKNMTVDLAAQSVKIGEEPLLLTKTEYSILTLLLKNVANYVSRAEIHRKVWNNEGAGSNERIVDTNISRLRKKLGVLGDYIVNRSGHGYMIS